MASPSPKRPRPDTISFAIPGAGTHTIALLSPLPLVFDPAVIDATTQPGFAGMPLVELDGSSAGANANGLDVLADNAVRGLVINRFSGSAIFLHGGGNLIATNYLGTDASGTTARANGGFGVLAIDSANNVIGGTTAADRNVISANSHGIYITGSLSVGNLIQGNFIGTDRTGHAALGNAPFHGVPIDGASNNTIGGTAPGARNVISANGFGGALSANAGVATGGSGAAGNHVQGNLIGTDVSGANRLGNNTTGVFIAAPGNIIGGVTPAERNVISATNGAGVFLFSADAVDNHIEGNFIGTDATAMHPLGNIDGVVTYLSLGNTIGGGVPGAGNVIAANSNEGIRIGGDGNRIQGNYVGTNAAGATGLGNANSGIAVDGGIDNVVGGTSAAT